MVTSRETILKSIMVNLWLQFEHLHGCKFSAGVDGVHLSDFQLDKWSSQTGVKVYKFNSSIYGFVDETDAIIFSLKFN